MREFSVLKKRISEYLEYKGISKYKFYQQTGISNGILSQKSGLTEENVMRFLSCYDDVNLYWLFTGVGQITRTSDSDSLDEKSFLKEKLSLMEENKTILQEKINLLEKINLQSEEIINLKSRIEHLSESNLGNLKEYQVSKMMTR